MSFIITQADYAKFSFKSKRNKGKPNVFLSESFPKLRPNRLNFLVKGTNVQLTDNILY